MPHTQMHLLGHICIGPTNHHLGGWRHPDSDVDLLLDPGRYEDLARIYERGLFDGAFIVDLQYVSGLAQGRAGVALEFGGQHYMLDPMQVLAVMSRVTRRLGLVATMSTSFNPPYRIARQFATLDHLSHGRAGWNIVTSIFDDEARNFGHDRMPNKAVRYDQADQVVEACMELWDTWQPQAFSPDRATGRFADPEGVRLVSYENTMVRVNGGLSTPQSPQGHPVLMQAGASKRGLDFAARWAEVIFTHQEARPRMQSFYAEVKDLAVSYGRDPDGCLVMPSVEVITGTSDAEAQEHAGELDDLVHPAAEIGMLANLFGVQPGELAAVDPVTPVSQVPVGGRGQSEGGYKNLLAVRRDGRELTLAEAGRLNATTWLSPRLVGSANTVVDELEDMFRSNCCDGFIITQALSPGGLTRFVDLVVPELQRRCLYRRRYAGTTLRQNLAPAAAS
jgi:FMN-dependent oxidoreductase (nitrilotriacetate monooxygenase family)